MIGAMSRWMLVFLAFTFLIFTPTVVFVCGNVLGTMSDGDTCLSHLLANKESLERPLSAFQLDLPTGWLMAGPRPQPSPSLSSHQPTPFYPSSPLLVKPSPFLHAITSVSSRSTYRSREFLCYQNASFPGLGPVFSWFCSGSRPRHPSLLLMVAPK